MAKKFKFYADAGHGWLAVKLGLLSKLDLLDKVSSSSYAKGKTVYLEEDQDMQLFKAAYEAESVVPMEIFTFDHGDRSWIRNMPSYKKPETVDFPLTIDSIKAVATIINVSDPEVNSEK